MIRKDEVSGYKLFEGLTTEELAKVLAICQEGDYQQNEVIIEPADSGLSLYLILQGRAVVELDVSRLHNAQQKNLDLATLRPGDVFGEMSFLEKRPRTARITAIDEVRALRIDNHKLDELFAQDCRLGYVVVRNLATILSQRLLDIGFRLRDNL